MATIRYSNITGIHRLNRFQRILMRIKFYEWHNLDHECYLYNLKHSSNITAAEYIEKVYHAILNTDSDGNMNLSFKTPKYETFYLLNRTTRSKIV